MGSLDCCEGKTAIDSDGSPAQLRTTKLFKSPIHVIMADGYSCTQLAKVLNYYLPCMHCVVFRTQGSEQRPSARVLHAAGYVL